MPEWSAIQPACRPITSTTMTRLCDSAVVCSRSIASVAIVDGRVEAEGVVGAVEVVVDRLRDADDREVVLGVEPRRDAERVLAADRDERVELLALEGREHPLDAALDLVRVRARGAEDRAAAREDPGDVAARRAARRSPRRARASPRARRRPPSRGRAQRRVTARMTAFRPGQSPPPVRIPTRCHAGSLAASALRRRRSRPAGTSRIAGCNELAQQLGGSTWRARRFPARRLAQVSDAHSAGAERSGVRMEMTHAVDRALSSADDSRRRSARPAVDGQRSAGRGRGERWRALPRDRALRS